MHLRKFFCGGDGVETEDKAATTAVPFNLHALYDSQIAAMAGDVEKKRVEILTEMREEQERQLQGFSFACQRFGDFLTLVVKREGNRNEKDMRGTPYGTSWSVSINLGMTSCVTYTEGRDVDEEGKLSYFVDESSPGVDHSPRFFDRPLIERVQKGETTVSVSPDYPDVLRGRMCFVSLSSDGEWRGRQSRARTVTPHFPRMAEDAIIRFVGTGTELCVPFGRGSVVYNAIMREIASVSFSLPITKETTSPCRYPA